MWQQHEVGSTSGSNPLPCTQHHAVPASLGVSAVHPYTHAVSMYILHPNNKSPESGAPPPDAVAEFPKALQRDTTDRTMTMTQEDRVIAGSIRHGHLLSVAVSVHAQVLAPLHAAQRHPMLPEVLVGPRHVATALRIVSRRRQLLLLLWRGWWWRRR